MNCASFSHVRVCSLQKPFSLHIDFRYVRTNYPEQVRAHYSVNARRKVEGKSLTSSEKSRSVNKPSGKESQRCIFFRNGMRSERSPNFSRRTCRQVSELLTMHYSAQSSVALNQVVLQRTSARANATHLQLPAPEGQSLAHGQIEMNRNSVLTSHVGDVVLARVPAAGDPAESLEL